MKRVWIAAITAGMLILPPACLGHSTADPSTGAAPDSAAADLAGTDVIAELGNSVNAKKTKLGDIVKATVTQDVLAHGRVVIRRGSKLLGHITQIKARSKEDPESRVALVFDKAVLKGGGEIDFTAALKALAPPMRGAVDQPDPMVPASLGPSRQGPAPMSGGMSSNSRMNTSNTTTNNSASVANQASRTEGMAAAASSTGKNQTGEAGLMGGGSRGVFGFPGLHLSAEPGGGHGTIISSTHDDVKLGGGTQLVIQINNVSQ